MRNQLGRRTNPMLYPLLYPFAEQFQAFNLFRYITFRSGGAVVTALLISFILGPRLILWLRRKQTNGQPIRPDGPNGHLLRKKGTPTMGGFLILLALTISTLLWADLSNPYAWIVLLVTVGFGLVGFFDDYAKLTKNSHRGLSGRTKLALEAMLGAAACIAIAYVTPAGLSTALVMPFFKNVLIQLGWFFVPFGVLVIVGASNAVNLTDGLDGLAIVPSMIAAGCFAFIAYLVGNLVFANYLQIHHVAGADQRHHQARAGACHHRRALRARGCIGHRPGRELQDDWSTRVSNGSASPPLRAVGLGRTDDRDPLLDHCVDPGDRRACDAEVAVAG